MHHHDEIYLVDEINVSISILDSATNLYMLNEIIEKSLTFRVSC